MFETRVGACGRGRAFGPSLVLCGPRCRGASRSLGAGGRNRQCFGPRDQASGQGLGRRTRCPARPAAALVAAAASSSDLPLNSVSVVFLSGGVGKRMGAKMPKQ